MTRQNSMAAERLRDASRGPGRHLYTCLFFLLSVLFLLPTVPCKADSMAAKMDIAVPVRVGIFDNKPMCYFDEAGNPVGIFVEVLQYTAQAEGWQLQYVQDSWSNLRMKLEQGEIDILLSMALSEERMKIYAFNETDVFNNWAEVYVRPNSQILSLMDLKKKRVSAMANAIFTNGPQGIIHLSDQFQLACSFVYKDSYKLSMEAVHNGEADAAVVNRLTGAAYKDEYGLEKSGIVFAPIKIRFGLNKHSIMTPILAEALDRHMKDLLQDGNSGYHLSIRKALGDNVSPIVIKKVPKWVQPVVSLSAAFILLLLFGTLFLRWQIRQKTSALKKANQELQEQINRQQLAQDNLLMAREKLRQYIDVSSFMLVVLDAEGKVELINPKGCEILKYDTPQDIIGKDWVEFFIPERQRTEIKEVFSRLMAGEGIEQVEYFVNPVLDSVGQERLMAFHNGVIHNKQGEIIGLISSGEDITERYQVEEEIKKSRKLLQETQKITKLGGWEYDVAANRLTWTSETCLIHEVADDYDPNDVKTAIDFYDTEAHEIISRSFADAVKEGKPYDLELPFITAKGNRRWVRTSAKADIHEGKVHRVLGMIMDITETRQQQEELRQTNEELQTINRIITAITTTTDIKDVLEKVLDEALLFSGMEGGAVCIIGPDEKFLLTAPKKLSEEIRMDLTANNVRVGDGLCGECARNYTPRILKNREEVLTCARRESQRQEDIRYHASFPLMIGTRCLGVLCVFTHTENTMNKRQLTLLKSISSQIAIAVENVQMLEKISRHAASLEEKVKERTADLEQSQQAMQLLLEDTEEAQQKLRRLNKQFVGRELRMRELKAEIAELKGTTKTEGTEAEVKNSEIRL